MRLRAGPAAAALLGAIGLAAPARAQRVDGRASLTMSGSYNQTLTDAAFPTSETQRGPALSIAPSGILLIDTPLTNNTITSAFSLSVPFTKDVQVVSAPLTYSLRLTYSGRYTLDDLSTMTLSSNFAYTPLNTLSGGGGDPTQEPVEATPFGAAYTLSTGLTEAFTRQLSESWSATQSSSLTYAAPIDPMYIHPKTVSSQNSVTLTRRFNRDTVGLVGSFAVNYFTVGETAGGQLSDPSTQLTDSLALTWTHPWTEALTMTANAGLTQVISPSATTLTAVEPTGTLSLTYRLALTVLTAQYAHQASPNLASGSVAFTDAATLRFSVPFGASGLTTSGSGGYTHAAPIGGNGTTMVSSPTDVIVADAALTYRPARLPALSTSLRGQLQRQIATVDPESGFTRMSLSLSLTFSYPSAAAAQTVPSMAPPLGMTGYSPTDVTTSDRIDADPEPEQPPTETPPPETAP